MRLGPESGLLATVTNALRLLQEFTYAEPVLGVSELGRRLGISKSSVHRILSTLCHEGFVSRTADGRYRLGYTLHELGQRVVHSTRLHEAAQPVLQQLRNDTGETTHLAVLDGTGVVYLERFESPGMVRLLGSLGTRMPAHATSSGKCLLAWGTAAQVDEVIAAGLERLAPRTLTSPELFRAHLADVRRQGYATAFEERLKGIASVGAPVFGADGLIKAAISVAGPTLRVNRDSLPRHVALVGRAGATISQHLGYRIRPVNPANSSD